MRAGGDPTRVSCASVLMAIKATPLDGLRECGKWWAGETDPASPHMSPLYADLTGLPAMTLFQGARDIFVVDARTFAESSKILCEYPGTIHVFMGATFTPEAKDVFRHVRALVDA